MDLGMSNFETPRIKVNDKDGLPILVEAVITWRFEDTAAAHYQLENYNYFMHKQSEAAIRELCTSYSYDSPNEKEHTLTNS